MGGKECKDDSRLLRVEGFYKMMKLYLSSGIPPCVGDYYVKCYLLNVRGLKPGVKELKDEVIDDGGGVIEASQQKIEEDMVAFENVDVQEPAQKEDVDSFPMEVVI